jgi:hypothetical protein
MLRATRASYPAGGTSSSTGSPYWARLVAVTMGGWWLLLVAMTGSQPRKVMAGSRLSVRIQMGSAAVMATTQRTAPTPTAAVIRRGAWPRDQSRPGAPRRPGAGGSVGLAVVVAPLRLGSLAGLEARCEGDVHAQQPMPRGVPSGAGKPLAGIDLKGAKVDDQQG